MILHISNSSSFRAFKFFSIQGVFSGKINHTNYNLCPFFCRIECLQKISPPPLHRASTENPSNAHANHYNLPHISFLFSSSISPFSIWPQATIRISQSTPKIPIQGPSIKISAFPFPRIRWSPHTKVRIHVMSYRGKNTKEKKLTPVRRSVSHRNAL